MPYKEQGYEGSQAKKFYFRTKRVTRGHTLTEIRFEKLKSIIDQKNLSWQNFLAQHRHTSCGTRISFTEKFYQKKENNNFLLRNPLAPRENN